MRRYSIGEPTRTAGTCRGGTHRRRAPLTLDGGWTPRSSHVTRAERFIERSGVLPVLQSQLDATTGRPRFLSIKALLVAMMLNGMRDDHKALIHRVASTIDALSRHRLQQLGCRVDHWPRDLYKRVDYLFNELANALEEGFCADIDGQTVTIDHVWFANRIGTSPVTDDILRMSHSVAVDGTALPTPARLLTGPSDLVEEVVHDGADLDSQPVDRNGRAPAGEERPKARILGYGIHDRRKVYTKDPDARGGYRTTTSQQPGGTYVGYEAHFGVLTRDVTWSNGSDKTTLSDAVPPVITSLALVPAGSSRTKPVVELLTDPRLRRHEAKDVIVDPGYSIPDPQTFFTPLHQAGIHVTWQVTSHHRGIQPFNDNAFIYNGHLISEALPQHLRDLSFPPMGANEAERTRYQKDWNRVALYRYSPHGSTAANGTTRFRDPIDAGRLRSRDVPASMRRARHAPLVSLPEPGTYEATLRATAEQLPRWSKYLPGTTAHDIAYNSRRQVVESANGAFRGALTHFDGGYVRVFGLTRISILIAFSVAGYNNQRIAAYCRANNLDDPNGGAALAREAATDTTEPDACEAFAVRISGTDPPA